MREPCPTKSLKVYTPRRINNHNNFPVYSRENGNLLFYFHISKKGQKYLSFGLNLKDYFGVAAAVFSAVDPVSWLSSGSLNRSDVFRLSLEDWYTSGCSTTRVTKPITMLQLAVRHL